MRSRSALPVVVTLLAACLSVAKVHAQALTNGPWTYVINSSSEATILGYSGSASEVVVPAIIDGYAVRIVGSDRPIFGYYNTSVSNVVIPSGVKELGFYSFGSCTGLTNISLPEGLRVIGYAAFGGSGLITVSIPDSVVELGGESFTRCVNLRSVRIGNSVRAIDRWTFLGCESLDAISIPQSVTRIEEAAFQECISLSNVAISTGVEFIGRNAFLSCLSLKEFNISPDNAQFKSVDGVLFTKNQERLIKFPSGKVGHYAIPAGVASIDDYAFADSTSITSISIPNSVTNLGSGAFISAGLTNVTIPNSVTDIPHSAFRNCRGLTSVTIPNSVTNIGHYSFSGCTSLSNVIIPSSVTDIGYFAFLSCSNLTSAVIGERVATIGGYAFESCGALKSVVFKGAPPTHSTNMFINTANVTIYHLSKSEVWPASFAGIATQAFRPVSCAPNFDPVLGFQFAWTNSGSIPMNVERATSLGGPWTLLSSLNVTSQFNDPSPPAGKAFYRALLP
jgi:hypothetical protein